MEEAFDVDVAYNADKYEGIHGQSSFCQRCKVASRHFMPLNWKLQKQVSFSNIQNGLDHLENAQMWTQQQCSSGHVKFSEAFHL